MKTQNGYVALSSILVISVILTAVVIAATLQSTSSSQVSTSQSKKETSLGFVEACAEDALIQINKNNSITSPIVLPEGSCTATINSQVGAAWTYTVTGTSGDYTKSIQVSANRAATVTITSWQEI